MALLLAGCGSNDPSRDPAPSVRLACISLREAACEALAGEVRQRLAGSGVVAITVEAFSCDVGQCPPGFEARQEYSIVAELTAPTRIRQYLATTMFTGSLRIDGGMDAESVEVRPTSVRTGDRVRPFTIGHCGLSSPIDVDGSLWDPVGTIDGTHPAAINAASGQFTLAGETTARFETDSGFAVSLLRRDGPKAFRLCA
jgi:hypothetical protein